ncbi:unnamed protein product [Parajaminaea phylloscopi]
MLLRLPDEVAAQIATLSSHGEPVRITWPEGSGPATSVILSVGTNQHTLSARSAHTDDGTVQSLYRVDDAGIDGRNKDEVAPGRLSCVQPISYRLTLKTSKASSSHDVAAQRLKEKREEERERKKSSRAVMLEQGEFDKRGRLASASKASASTSGKRGGLGSATSEEVRRTTSPAQSALDKGRSGGLVRSRSYLAQELLDEDARRGRSSSPAGPAGRIATSASPSFSGPSLRQKILYVLASGPKPRRRIVASIGSPEPPILRLLGALAHTPDGIEDAEDTISDSARGNGSSPKAKRYAGPVNRRTSARPSNGSANQAAGSVAAVSSSNPSTLFALRDDAYREVAAAVGAGYWDDDTLLADKAKIWTLTTKALRRIATPADADEWAWINLWQGSVKELQQQREQESQMQASSAPSPQRMDEDANELGRRDTPSVRGDSPNTESPLAAMPQAAATGKKKAGSTTRDRLTRAVKGRGPKGEDLKKEQEKLRKRHEREQADERKASPGKIEHNAGAMSSEGIEEGQRRAQSGQPQSSPQKERDATSDKKRKRVTEAEETVRSPPSKDSRRLSDKFDHELPSKKSRVSATTEASTGGSKALAASLPPPLAPASTVSSDAGKDLRGAKSASAVANRTRRASATKVASATVPPVNKTQEQQHHGPSASASLLVPEPWLDIRGPAEWRRLAERFARVWSQYEVSAAELNRERNRLLRERERAARDLNGQAHGGTKDVESSQSGVAASPKSTAGGSIRASWRPRSSTHTQHDSHNSPSRAAKDVNGKNRSVIDSSDEGTTSEAQRTSAASPIDLADLTRLVESQKAREGELRRMKKALTRWKRSHEATDASGT